mmetsp:Transcript_30474/g.94658  ORF Transcript_30474/g.94658 Transcript_30474/m.94658 type:complete len:406 (-) Transcript_30474:160-1377(-)
MQIRWALQREGPHDVHGKVWAVIITFVVFGSIGALLTPRGFRTAMTTCLYVASLVAIALTMRELSRPPLLYRFPAFVTLLHYLCTWAFCLCYWLLNRQPEKCNPRSIGPMRRIVVSIVPIALALPISISLNNKALVFIGAGLVAIVGTLSPVCTAILSRLFGRRLSVISWLGVAVAFGGAFWLGLTELQIILHRESSINAHAKIKGMILALGAVASRSVRVVLQDCLLSPVSYGGGKPAEWKTSSAVASLEDTVGTHRKDTGESGQLPDEDKPLTGLHLLAVQSPAVICVATVFAFATERVSLAVRSITVPVAEMLVATCVVAVLLNVLSACVLKDLGSTSMQIIGKLNTIVTTAVSMAFFNESLPVVVLLGCGVVLVGVAIFELGETQPKVPPKTASGPAGKLA